MIVRSPEEIAILREGGKTLARILRELAEELSPGMATAEIDRRARAKIARAGDEAVLFGYRPPFAKRPYPGAICVSVNDEIVHGIPREDRILAEGDIVGLDLAIRHRGLIVDAALTAPVGEIDADARRLIGAVTEALAAGVAAAKAGNRIGDVSHAIETVFECRGFRTPPTLGGHGVGRKVHEDPEIPNVGDPGTGPRILPGMVLAIEPMANEGAAEDVVDADGYTVRTADGKRSAHFEHTVLAGEAGPEILTRE